MPYFYRSIRFVLLGLFLFTPHLAVLGYTVKTIYIICVLAIFGLFFKRSVDSKLLILVSVVFLLLCIGFIFNQTVSLELVRQVFIFSMLFLAYEAMSGQRREGFSNSFRLISYIKIWLLLQSLAIIASALLDGFSDSFHSIFVLTDKAERYIGANVLVNRYAGFAPSGFSLLSVYMALLAILVNESTDKGERSVAHFGIILVVMFALIFVGRSGLYYLIMYFILSGTVFRLRSFAIVLGVVFFTVGFASNISLALFNYFDFAFELFLNGFSSTSTDTLADNEVFVPDASFFGSGNLVRAEGGAGSDIGWIKLLTCFGYLGVLIYFSSFLYVFSNGLKAKSWRSPVFLYLLAAMFIFNFKDLYLLSSGYIQVFIIMYFMHRSSFGGTHD